MKQQFSNKFLSMLLAFVFVLGLAVAMPVGAAEGTVYLNTDFTGFAVDTALSDS